MIGVLFLLGGAAAGNEVTVQLKWFHQYQFAGYYAAEQQGYFEAEGLKVRLVEGGPDVEPLDQVLSGEADFGILTADLLEERLAGKPVVAVATFYQYSPYVLLTVEGRGMESAADLAGKRIAARGGVLPSELLGLLAKAGVDAGAYEVVASARPLEELLAGEVDAIASYITDQLYQVRASGLKPLVFHPLEHGIDFYGDTLFALESFADANPDVVVALRNAVIQGWEHALEHPASVVEHILELESKRPSPATRSALEYEHSQSRQLLQPGLVDLGHMSRSRWHQMADTLVVLGRAPEGFSLDGFLFDPESEAERMRFLIIGVLLAGGLTLFVMLLILVWNRQLRRQVSERTEELRAKTVALEKEIGERRVAESQLRRLVDIIEATTDCVGMCDATGRGTYLNSTGRKMLGLAPDEDPSSVTFLELHPPREHSRFQEEIIPQVRTQGYWLGEMTMQDRRGRELLVSQLIIGHKGEDGKVRFFSTIARDITEQKRQEKALRESRRTLLTLVSNLPGMAYRCKNDEEWTSEFVSVGSTELTGYEPGEIIGNAVISLNRMVHEKDRLMAWELVQEALKRREPFQMQYRLITKSGEMKWIWELGRGVFTKRGHFVAIEGLLLDITQRKNAEEAMTRMRLYLKSVIDSMPSILVAVDPEGRVTHWNIEAENMTGVGAEEAQGALVTDVLPILSSQMPRIREAIRLRRPAKSENRRVAFNGRRMNLEFMVYPLMATGIEGAVIRIDDITQRVRLEEVMAQTEKMMLVGGLAAGMAHEINNPLGGILQAVNNIRRRISDELTENREAAAEAGFELAALHEYFEARKIDVFLDHIAEACERAAAIVSDMLAFSRAGETTYMPTPVDELVATAVRWAHNDIDMRHGHDGAPIQLVSDCHPDAGTVACDPAKIQQVLLNLIRNAVQALQESGEEAHPLVTVRATGDEEQVRIEVQDNGPGMSEEAQRRAFEPFFTTKEVGVGTGLGLSVSYFLIVDQHHGTIEVQSEPGKGTRFVICLPRVQQGAAESASEAVPV